LNLNAWKKSFVLNNNGEINIVPCSKSEVFKSKNISLVEKRYLMKFLDAFLKPNEGDLIELEEYSEKSLLSYLEHKNLSENLKSYILYCIALLNEEQTEENNITTKDGLNLVKRYLKSIEMYGLSPFFILFIWNWRYFTSFLQSIRCLWRNFYP